MSQHDGAIAATVLLMAGSKHAGDAIGGLIG